MTAAALSAVEAVFQRDVNQRGLASDPRENLITACRNDFEAACVSLASSQPRTAIIVTGFYIPSAGLAETDGPLGAFFLGRALARLGWHVHLFSESSCHAALSAALRLIAHEVESHAGSLSVEAIPRSGDLPSDALARCGWESDIAARPFREAPSHLIAIERVGPSYADAAVPAEHRDQCHTMRGLIVTPEMYPAHRWFEQRPATVTSIGIGDGGNEIGMGKVSRAVIARNIARGELVACRIATDYNIVSGISNWAAYGLAAGVFFLKQRPFDRSLFDLDAEGELWERALREAPLVDGMTGRVGLAVDGLSWPQHVAPVREMFTLLEHEA